MHFPALYNFLRSETSLACFNPWRDEKSPVLPCYMCKPLWGSTKLWCMKEKPVLVLCWGGVKEYLHSKPIMILLNPTTGWGRKREKWRGLGGRGVCKRARDAATQSDCLATAGSPALSITWFLRSEVIPADEYQAEASRTLERKGVVFTPRVWKVYFRNLFCQHEIVNLSHIGKIMSANFRFFPRNAII